MRLLIAEDDGALGGFLARGLRDEVEQIEIARNGQQAMEMFLRDEPDLLILDLDLPLHSGLEVLALVRSLSSFCAVLVLSGRAETATRIACLEQGADDCMLKPFSLAELRARCRAMLRRREAVETKLEQSHDALQEGLASLAMGALELERMTRRVTVAGMPLHLTNHEFRLLEQFLLSAGAAVSRSVLRDALWGGRTVETNALDVHVGALRRKLGTFHGAPVIETMRGSGYRLRSLPEQQEPYRYAPSPTSAGA